MQTEKKVDLIMGKFTGYLICTDCDGTLTYEPGKVSDENAKAIKYFQEEGGLFTLATGRFPDHIDLFKDKIQINAPMVSLNGTLLYDVDNGGMINKWVLPTEQCYELLSYVKKSYDKLQDFWINGVLSDGTFGSISYNLFEHSSEDNSLKKALEKFPCEMLKMVIAGNAEVIIKLQADLKKKFGQRFRFDTSWPEGLEIQAIDSGKGVAVEFMKSHLGTEIHTTIGVGDYENDITLLECADIGYAVDNAIDSVKKIADRITVSNREHALAAIINDLERRL
ncbi:MAG: HAD-IIB family hydrolase [Eubacterium sp.]|nr:HAD-IIB family hydrolase [Eubacterium sp.]